MTALIISLISGAVGGNVVAKLAENLNQGTLINSISGIVGGGLGSSILGAIVPAMAGGGMDIGGILSQVAGGGVGGGIVLWLVGLVRGMIGK